MAKIIDPDLLNQGTEVVFDTVAKTIKLNIAGNLTQDGVTLQCLYSFAKEEWKLDANLIKHDFPFVAITETKFDLVNGWDFADNATRLLIRDGGWAVKDAANNSLSEYACIITLGNFDNPATDTAYYLQSPNGTPVNFNLPGPVNQAIQIFGDATHGNFDYRNYLRLFLRIQGKKYDETSIAAIGVSNMTYTTYAFPLSNAVDLKITTPDSGIDATGDGVPDVAPYSGMSITYLNGTGFTTWAAGTTYAANSVVQDPATGRWFITAAGGTSAAGATSVATDTGITDWTPYTGERQVGNAWYPYNVIINGNNGTAEQIYEFAQFELRQSVDIDAGPGTVIGQTASSLLHFVGDTLITVDGVFIDGYQATDVNRIEFTDVTGTKRLFPYVAAGNIYCNDNLVNDPDAVFTMFFADPDGVPNSGDEFGTAGAIIVNDNTGTPIQGAVAGRSVIPFTFDYDGNTQGGRAVGTDVPVVVVAIGLSTGQYVKATATIIRSNNNSISLVSSLERNYSNPNGIGVI